MKIVKEFSRFADEYNKYNIIQTEVAKHLISMLKKKRYDKVLDLGSGSGAVYKNLKERGVEFNHFYAFDFSEEMLKIHPSSKNLSKLCLNFNDKSSFQDYQENEFDLLTSASALQWSEDLSLVLDSISFLALESVFAFFTSNTFTTLHKTAGVKSPIYSKEFILDTLKDYYTFESEVKEYHLPFTSVEKMLSYIKHSGVSGGTGVLSYKEIKRLIREYPLGYLEFEVLFVKAVKL